MICRHRTQAWVVSKVPHMILTCSQGWQPLVYLFSLGPWEYRTNPIPFSALIYFTNLYGVSMLCQAMGYMLGIGSEREKSVTGRCPCLWSWTFLHMLPHSALSPFILDRKVGLWMQCSWLWCLFSRTPGKVHSCFCASHSVLDSTEYLENLYLSAFTRRRKILLFVCFFSCTNLLLCLSLYGCRVIYGLLNL